MGGPKGSGSPETSSTRKRKAHTKSRGGCGNCKLRRVKCDEGKPSCKRCTSYGVSCTYDRISHDLQPVSEGAFVVNAPQLNVDPISMSKTFLTLLNDSLQRQAVKDRAWQLSNYDLVLLNKFHERTSLTIGTERTRNLLQHEGLKLAFRHSFLMHIALTFTLMHERSHSVDAKQSTAELFHWCRGVQEFNSKLSSNSLTSSEKDAIWVTAALLGCTSLAQVDGRIPEEVWPLKEPSPSDLDWLKMSEGKKEVWRVADLSRPDSALRALTYVPIDDVMTKPTDEEAFANLPPEFLEICGITEGSNRENNDYYALLSVVGRLMPISPTQANLIRFMTFLGQMSANYRSLLEQKEPRAMLLLAWYHAKVSQHHHWWWWKRASLEGRAMCIYLERYHSDIPHMLKLLEFPKANCHRAYQAGSPVSTSTSSSLSLAPTPSTPASTPPASLPP